MRRRVRGSGRTFQRGNRWWISYYVAGVEQREAGGDTEAAANAVLTERVASLGRGVPVTAEAGRLTIADAVENWYAHLVEQKAKGLVQARSKKKHLVRLLGDVRIGRLTPQIVRTRYVAARREEHITDTRTVTDGTIRGELLSLTAAMNLLRKEGRIVHVPHVPKPPAPAPRRGYPEPETLATILPAIKGDAYRDAIEYGDATGRRSAEIVGLRWEQVFLRDGEIRMGETKNGDPVTIPIEGGVASVLGRRVRARDLSVPSVFHHRKKALNAKTLLRRFKKACEVAGTEIHLVHNLRRSGVRNLRRGGASEEVAMSISGHRDRGVFRRYNVTSTADQRAALQGVAAYRAQRIADISRTP